MMAEHYPMVSAAAEPPEAASTGADPTGLRAVIEQLLLAQPGEQRLAAEARGLADMLAHQALHDGLTGLPNRALCHERLRQALVAAHREGTTLALLFLDLDGFKDVNDTLGHHAGDLVLQQVAARLRATLREADTAARLGGDEFAVLLAGPIDPASARHAAHRIVAALEPPCMIRGLPQRIRASIGVAVYPAHGAEVDTLLQRADAAMYAAKRTGVTIAVAGFAGDRVDRRVSCDGVTAASTRATRGSATTSALTELRSANEQLLLAGLREQELAERLRRQLAFTAALTDNLGEGVYALDAACRITFVNPAAERLAGRAEAELLGRDIHEALPCHCARGAGSPAALCPLAEVLHSGVAHRDEEAIFTRRDGTTFPCAYSAAPIVAGGRVTGAVVAFRDIGARRASCVIPLSTVSEERRTSGNLSASAG